MGPGTLTLCSIGATLLFVIPFESSAIPVHKTERLGQSALLPCSGPAGTDVEWHFKQFDYSQWQAVAGLSSGAISAGSGYEGRLKSVRMEQPGDYSVTLSSVAFNDGGLYECRPKNNTQTLFSDVILKVIIPSQVSVAIGEPATLLCFGNIKKQALCNDLHVQWQRDGQLICQLLDGKVTCGPGFENRASLSINSILEGNLSLTITPTRSSDEGHYQCFYNKENDKGTPASVSLAVTDSSLSGGAVAWIVIGVLAAVGVVGASLYILWHKRLKEKSSPETPVAYQRAKAEDEDGNCQMLAVQSDGQSSPDLPLPVCETQPDEPPPSKPFSSGTEPFTDETETSESEAQRFVTEKQGFVSETERPSVTETQLLTAVTGPDSQTPAPEIGFSQPETAAEGKADYDL